MLYPLFMLSFIHCLALCQQKPTIYIHDKIIKSKQSTFLELAQYKPKCINVTYTPQQVVRVRSSSKKLPLQSHVYGRGMQYLKYIAEDKKTDNLAKKAVELLVCTEPFGKQMHALLNDKTQLSSNDKVVRLYRKVEGEQSKKLIWKPIMTVPEQNFKQHLQANITVSPKGKLLLENI